MVVPVYGMQQSKYGPLVRRGQEACLKLQQQRDEAYQHWVLCREQLIAVLYELSQLREQRACLQKENNALCAAICQLSQLHKQENENFEELAKRVKSLLKR
jgi:hypothetical protein